MDAPLQENCHTYLLLSVEEQSCNTYRVDSSADFKSTDSQKGMHPEILQAIEAKPVILKLLLTNF